MEYKDYPFTLGMKENIFNSIQPKQGETAVRLLVTLTDNGQVYDLTDTTVKAIFVKPDRTVSKLDCKMENAAEGAISTVLTNQILAVPGRVHCEIQITGDKGLAKSWTFSMLVQKSIGTAEIESSNELAMLDQALIDTENMLTLAMEQEGERQDNETVRVSNENSRKNIESIRVNKEIDRVLGEMTRTSNENTRLDAEESRNVAEAERQTNTTQAINNANTAASNANNKADLANAAANSANSAANSANSAATLANEKATLAEEKANLANAATISTNEATTNANNAATDANAAAENINSHLNNNMPHLIKDLDSNKTYRYGLQVIDGSTQIIYEEVI